MYLRYNPGCSGYRALGSCSQRLCCLLHSQTSLRLAHLAHTGRLYSMLNLAACLDRLAQDHRRVVTNEVATRWHVACHDRSCRGLILPAFTQAQRLTRVAHSAWCITRPHAADTASPPAIAHAPSVSARLDSGVEVMPNGTLEFTMTLPGVGDEQAVLTSTPLTVMCPASKLRTSRVLQLQVYNSEGQAAAALWRLHVPATEADTARAELPCTPDGRLPVQWIGSWGPAGPRDGLISWIQEHSDEPSVAEAPSSPEPPGFGLGDELFMSGVSPEAQELDLLMSDGLQLDMPGMLGEFGGAAAPQEPASPLLGQAHLEAAGSALVAAEAPHVTPDVSTEQASAAASTASAGTSATPSSAGTAVSGTGTELGTPSSAGHAAATPGSFGQEVACSSPSAAPSGPSSDQDSDAMSSCAEEHSSPALQALGGVSGGAELQQAGASAAASPLAEQVGVPDFYDGDMSELFSSYVHVEQAGSSCWDTLLAATSSITSAACSEMGEFVAPTISDGLLVHLQEQLVERQYLLKPSDIKAVMHAAMCVCTRLEGSFAEVSAMAQHPYAAECDAWPAAVAMAGTAGAAIAATLEALWLAVPEHAERSQAVDACTTLRSACFAVDRSLYDHAWTFSQCEKPLGLLRIAARAYTAQHPALQPVPLPPMLRGAWLIRTPLLDPPASAPASRSLAAAPRVPRAAAAAARTMLGSRLRLDPSAVQHVAACLAMSDSDTDDFMLPRHADQAPLLDLPAPDSPFGHGAGGDSTSSDSFIQLVGVQHEDSSSEDSDSEAEVMRREHSIASLGPGTLATSSAAVVLASAARHQESVRRRERAARRDSVRLEHEASMSPEESPDVSYEHADAKAHSQFYDLAAAGLVQGMQHMIDLNYNASVPYRCQVRGWTALHAATFNGHEEAVQLLLQHTPRTFVDYPCIAGESALHFAAFKGYHKITELLITSGADPAALGSDEQHALQLAVRHCPATAAALVAAAGTPGVDFGLTINCILQAAPELALEPALPESYPAVPLKEKTMPPLLLAALRGLDPVVLQLIATGAPLAYEQRRVDVGSLLLEQQMNAGQQAVFKTLVLKIKQHVSEPMRTLAFKSQAFLSAYYGRAEALELLLQHQLVNVAWRCEDELRDRAKFHNATLFQVACRQSHASIVELLVNHRCIAVNPRHGDHPVLLDLVALSQRLFVQLLPKLVEQGIDLDASDEGGQTALHVAVQKQRVQSAEALLLAGANPNLLASDGSLSPLLDVCRSPSDSCFQVAQLLLEHGADPNLASDEGDTPLHLAAYIGSTRLVSLLLEAGADVNAVDKKGSVPAAMAVEHHDCVKLWQQLYEFGADLRCGYQEGSPLLSYASEAGNIKVMIDMLSKGADPHTVDNKGLNVHQRTVRWLERDVQSNYPKGTIPKTALQEYKRTIKCILYLEQHYPMLSKWEPADTRLHVAKHTVQHQVRNSASPSSPASSAKSTPKTSASSCAARARRAAERVSPARATQGPAGGTRRSLNRGSSSRAKSPSREPGVPVKAGVKRRAQRSHSPNTSSRRQPRPQTPDRTSQESSSVVVLSSDSDERSTPDRG